MVPWVENMCDKGTGDEGTGNIRTTGDKESYEGIQRSDSVAWKEGWFGVEWWLRNWRRGGIRV